MTSNPERDLHTYLAADVAPTGIRTDEFGRLHNQRVSAPAGLPLHEPTDRDADNVPSDRVRAYAEALRNPGAFVERLTVTDAYADGRPSRETLAAWETRAVMAVADREQAELRAEVERWRGRADRRLAEAKKAEAELADARAELDRLRSADGTH